MKKKLLYIFLITFILISPILYWLDSRWGITVSQIDIRKLRFAFVNDKFLFIATVTNFILYFFGIYKIFNMSSEASKNNTNTNTGLGYKTESGKEIGHYRNNIMLASSTGTGHINPNDEKWKNMYDTNKVVNIPEKKQDISPSPVSSGENTVVPIEQTPPVIQSSNIPVAVAPDVVQKEETITTTAPVTTPVPDDNNVINIDNNVSLKDIYASRIEEEFFKYGYENMGKANIEGDELDFIAIAESDTLILGIINSEYGDTVANETPTSPSLPPYWFTNEKKYASPVWAVKNVQNAVLKMINEVLPEDNGITVRPVVVMTNTAISNQNDMENKWKEMGVEVVRYDNTSSLPQLLDVIVDRKDTEVLESYRKFIETLLKYFAKRVKEPPLKKVG